MELMKDGSSKMSDPKNMAGFVVVLVAAVLVGGWLFIDSVRADLQGQVDDLRLTIESLK